MQRVPWPKRFFPLQFLGRTGLCFTDQETQEENTHGGPTPLWVSTYTSYLFYKVQDPFSASRHSHGRNVFFLFRFYGGPVFASQTKKLRKRICMVDQLPSGSVLTPAISCTKFKIHSAHPDIPMAETFFSSSDFTEDQSLLHRPRNSGREYAWWTNSLLGQYLHQLSLVQSSRLIQRMQTVPCPKRFFPLLILGRTSLCSTDQETQEENRHGGPTPLWVSTYTSYLLYKVQDPFSACRESHGRNVFFLFSF